MTNDLGTFLVYAAAILAMGLIGLSVQYAIIVLKAMWFVVIAFLVGVVLPIAVVAGSIGGVLYYLFTLLFS